MTVVCTYFFGVCNNENNAPVKTSTAKKHRPVTMLLRTGLINVVMPTLFKVVNNIDQQLLHAIQPQQCCSMLLATVHNMASTTLFNPVLLLAHNFWLCSLAFLSIAFYLVHAIATQAKSVGITATVTQYKLSCTLDDIHWRFYEEKGSVKVV